MASTLKEAPRYLLGTNVTGLAVLMKLEDSVINLCVLLCLEERSTNETALTARKFTAMAAKLPSQEALSS